MGALLLILALVFFLLGHPLFALICLILALVLLFVPGPYSRAGRYPGRW